jgi:hypothetical protein
MHLGGADACVDGVTFDPRPLGPPPLNSSPGDA